MMRMISDQSPSSSLERGNAQSWSYWTPRFKWPPPSLCKNNIGMTNHHLFHKKWIKDKSGWLQRMISRWWNESFLKYWYWNYSWNGSFCFSVELFLVTLTSLSVKTFMWKGNSVAVTVTTTTIIIPVVICHHNQQLALFPVQDLLGDDKLPSTNRPHTYTHTKWHTYCHAYMYSVQDLLGEEKLPSTNRPANKQRLMTPTVEKVCE